MVGGPVSDSQIIDQGMSNGYTPDIDGDGRPLGRPQRQWRLRYWADEKK